MTKETITLTASARPKRQPVGFRNRLTVKNQDPNFAYRIVNDTDDRIEMFREGGYELVDMGEGVGDKRMDNTINPDKSISVGGGTRGVLMRIPKNFYDEDQKVKQDKIEVQEKNLKTPSSDGSFGKIEITK